MCAAIGCVPDSRLSPSNGRFRASYTNCVGDIAVVGSFYRRKKLRVGGHPLRRCRRGSRLTPSEATELTERFPPAEVFCAVAGWKAA
jgi:hypothetical protein